MLQDAVGVRRTHVLFTLYGGTTSVRLSAHCSFQKAHHPLKSMQKSASMPTPGMLRLRMHMFEEVRCRQGLLTYTQYVSLHVCMVCVTMYSLFVSQCVYGVCVTMCVWCVCHNVCMVCVTMCVCGVHHNVCMVCITMCVWCVSQCVYGVCHNVCMVCVILCVWCVTTIHIDCTRFMTPG